MKRIIVCLLVCCLLCGCGVAEKPAQKTVFAMDTVMDLTLWGPDAQIAAEEIEKLIMQLDETWSVTRENSVLSRVNRGEAVPATGEEAVVFARAEALRDRTGGAFDPQLYGLSLTWGFLDQQYRVPTESEIQAAREDTRWNLGAAIKGYAGQRAVSILEPFDVSCGILNLGGNTQTYGQKQDGTPWRIAIQNPAGGNYAGVVSVTGTASIVTSGDYQRYFEQDGVVYHHILDPKTGRPAESGLSSVTVICRDGLTADALSTALFVMGLDAATAHWRQNNDFEAVFILDDGRIFATEGVALSDCVFEVIPRENEKLDFDF